jgi:5-methyltetrahydropteroyltriglutamate--homocysteine methyltransferase
VQNISNISTEIGISYFQYSITLSKFVSIDSDETTKISPNFDRFLGNCKRGVEFNGKTKSTPVVLGPVSWVRLAKIASTSSATKQSLIADLIPVYKNLLLQIKALGVKEIQIHEPALVFDEAELLPLFKSVYPVILPDGVSINMVSFMEDVGESNYKWLQSKDNGIDIVSLDFTRGETLQLIERNGWTNKTLGAGLIDARNVWKVIPDVTLPIINKLNSLNIKYRVQPSGSLQYTPWDFDNETELKTHVASNVLSFAKQKLGELKIIAAAANGTIDLSEHSAAWNTYHAGRKEISKFGAIVSERIANLKDPDFVRVEDYKTRRPKQLVGTPLLPTTTIGSFPQTKEIRRLRSLLNKGTLSKDEYEAAIDQQISFCIGIQEALGLDILVHGEPERTDMVEFFAQQMEGMLFTQQGWVQSFGSRCVRPPIFWTDIHRPEAMTTREYEVAQALTTKPVKGMVRYLSILCCMFSAQ